MTASPTTPLAAALAAAGRGWRVFPLRPGEKRPAVRGWETRATCDPDRIGRCWRAGPYGVGVACGPSGLVVVDLDQPKPGQAPPDTWVREAGITCGQDVLAALAEHAGQPYPADTYTVRTASGGQHLYFTAPPGGRLRNTAGVLGWLVDTRAAGGYVVAAGTVVDGRAYTVLDDTPPAPLPAWLTDALTPQTAPAPAAGPVQLAGGRRAAYVAAALRDETRRVSSAPAGRRNAALYMAAQVLGQLVAGELLDPDHIRAALLHAAEPHLAAGAYTGRQAQATIGSGLAAGARRPRTAGA